MTDTTAAAPTFPRSQHWRVEGFRITVLLYKSHRAETCRTCGRRGAIHAVWAHRGDGFDGPPADFCDRHRPAKGTLPDLDYRRHTHDGDHRDPRWTLVTERLVPSTEWPCTTCGQPSAIRRELRCGHCTEPGHYTVSTVRVMSWDGSDRTETSVGHDVHTLAETYQCEDHR